ncbi:hypothetical protein CLCR_11034 [Cladophialophora carrionii]|uniref:Uncharacterized protein n=1 Tax=Cladophialophora carrionii TaxID=86049 RepID=A0A1C1CYK5_9EURO|nr:hypothetical protein CLCR_11034 [Cladophialophora carrionii]
MLRGYTEASIQQRPQASNHRGFCLRCGKQPTDLVIRRLRLPQRLLLCAHISQAVCSPARKEQRQRRFPSLYPSQIGHANTSSVSADPASDQLAETKLGLEKAEDLADSVEVDA